MAGRVFSTAAGAIAAFLVLAAAPFAALAAEPGEPPSEPGSDDDASVKGRPLPRDDRTGHFTAFGGASVIVPGGDLGAGVTLSQIANAGVGGEAGIAIGLSRYSGLELRGQFVKLSSSSECPTCQSQMFAAGLGLTYHTAQALGFDPWVRFGAGYRALTVSGPLTDVLNTAPTPGTFQGVDFASFSLGGDYFPVPWFGIGIFFGGDVGVNVAAPDGRARGAIYGLFQAGLRIALEPQRKAVSVASSPPRGGIAVGQRSDFGPSLYNRAAQ